MTKQEKQIIISTLDEYRENMLKHYERAKKTGDWKEHEKACEAMRSVRELAQRLGIAV